MIDGKRKIEPIPERRPPEEIRNSKKGRAPAAMQAGNITGGSLPFPVWRCKVCGYLCAREGPPEVCPVCKAKKDRFERFI